MEPSPAPKPIVEPRHVIASSLDVSGGSADEDRRQKLELMKDAQVKITFLRLARAPYGFSIKRATTDESSLASLASWVK
jgi:hypothetical protein